ncbi:hypothetical protein Tco_1328399 [Tanacetum coccineum]
MRSGEGSAAVAAARQLEVHRADYGFVATMARVCFRLSDTEWVHTMWEFESLVRRDTDEIYTRLDDELGADDSYGVSRSVNMCFGIVRTFAHTVKLLGVRGWLVQMRLGDEPWIRGLNRIAHGVDAERMSELLENDRRRTGGDEKRAESCRPHSTRQQIRSDLDCCTDIYRGMMVPHTGTVRHTCRGRDRGGPAQKDADTEEAW